MSTAKAVGFGVQAKVGIGSPPLDSGERDTLRLAVEARGSRRRRLLEECESAGSRTLMAYRTPTIQHATEDFIHISLANPHTHLAGGPAHSPRTPRHVKRYGVIFPSSPFCLNTYPHDNDSTWTYKHSSRPSAKRQVSLQSSRSRTTTAAQDIAARYRATHLNDDPPPSDFSSVDHRDSETPCMMEIGPSSGPRMRIRQSGLYALGESAREAYFAMLQNGGADRDIPCPRRGCNNILPNMRALTSHIAIHTLDPADRCGKWFLPAGTLPD
ncbi:hypothetical protein A0H81_13798 [Grifola frondosa]|uniref:C2H2-type domain-containing protein n=1 Tax=Grifola frondosa TaxID=5627 RepID=A0A1C7LQA5_GRIFR|nr:hypothetical protein A0H81_13798 [Grifola frondosa]